MCDAPFIQIEYLKRLMHTDIGERPFTMQISNTSGPKYLPSLQYNCKVCVVYACFCKQHLLTI